MAITVQVFSREDIFGNLAQTHISGVFILGIIQRELQTCIEKTMSKLTIVPKPPSSAHSQHEKFIRIGTEARFFQLTSQEYTCIASLNK